MTSKTSYFEPALFLRGLKKTFPVWLAYVVLWILFLPLGILNQTQWTPDTSDIRELILSGAIASVVTTAILALALAWVLFRFLFRTATSYDIAALPVRRESLFCTNLLCGLAIALGTHLLIALITYGTSALIGFPNLSACMELVAAAMLSFLGFFGFAVLLCIVVGNAVAMPLIYIVLNFAVYVLVQISAQLLSNFVYGLGNVSDNVLYISAILSPIILVFAGNIQVIWGWNADYTDKVRVGIGGFPYFYIIAAMGLVCALLAFLLYRKREMERSGDVVAIRWLRPVFLYLFSIGCALVIGYLLSMFTNNADYNFLIMLALQLAGAFLGYFAAQMMLQKSARVFASKRAWIGFAVLCLVLAGTFSAARFGFFGYSQKVPDVRSVSSVSLRGTRVTEKDDIEAVVALHQEIVDQQETQLALLQSEPYDNCYVTFDYEMQNGRTLRRSFTINGTCELARKFDTLYNSPGFLLSREVIPGELKQSDFAGGAIQGYDKNNEPYYYNLSSKEAYELYTTCILPDLGDSSMGVRHYVNFPTMETEAEDDEIVWADISVELDMSDSWVPSDLRASRTEETYSLNYYYDLTTDAARSLAYAEAHGFLVP